MAKGKVTYRTGQNLEPVANAITSMGQSASKKDKPEVLGQKIKAISTDATAVEGNVLTGQTFYAAGQKKTGNMANNGAWNGRIGVNGKVVIPAGYHNGHGYVDQSITTKGASTAAVSVSGTNPMAVRIPQGYYGTNASSGYPEASVTLAQLRGAGLALQSELTAMTTDRDNWMNVANSRPQIWKTTLQISLTGTGTYTFPFNLYDIDADILCFRLLKYTKSNVWTNASEYIMPTCFGLARRGNSITVTKKAIIPYSVYDIFGISPVMDNSSYLYCFAYPYGESVNNYTAVFQVSLHEVVNDTYSDYAKGYLYLDRLVINAQAYNLVRECQIEVSAIKLS